MAIKHIDKFVSLRYIDVYKETNNSEYFQTYQLNDILPYGKSSFLIDITDNVFVNNSEILVEISNNKGEIIYSEIPKYIEGNLRRISIWVYPSDTEGEYTIFLVGKLKNVPHKWANTFNIRWSKKVYFQKALINNQPIRFYKTPTVTIAEERRSYKKRSFYNDESILYVTGELLYGYPSSSGEYQIEMKDNIFVDQMLDNGQIWTTNWSSSLAKIIDAHNAVVDNPYTTFTKLVNSNLGNSVVSRFEAMPYSMSYIAEAYYSSSENYQSFANINITNMETFSGEVNRIKTYLLSRGDNNEISSYINVGDSLVVASNEYGFTPQAFSYQIPIPTWARNDDLDFRIEFYNADNVLSEVVEALNIHFTGSNIFIEENDNVLTGSLFLSNTIGTGINMCGANSGYIKSIGYNGFVSASVYKTGSGFLMWTGSALSNITNEYYGVGLELYSNSSSYLRFRTDPSLLDIRTKTIFIGSTDLSYISASNGHIEISGSNFLLSESGDVYISGSINAEDGMIGGWSINKDVLTAGIVELHATSRSLYIKDDNNNIIINIGSSSIDTQNYGVNIPNGSMEEFTGTVPNNWYVKTGSLITTHQSTIKYDGTYSFAMSVEKIPMTPPQ